MSLICGTRHVAEEAVQEALARAWERSERGDEIESLRAWVTVVAANLARSSFRRRLAERRATRRMHGESNAAPTPDDLLDLRRALDRLPKRQREATVLRYYLDMDVAEVATALHMSEGTAKTTLFRARRALAAALGEKDDEPTPEATDVAGF